MFDACACVRGWLNAGAGVVWWLEEEVLLAAATKATCPLICFHFQVLAGGQQDNENKDEMCLCALWCRKEA